MKYAGINLTKYMRIHHIEHYKMLLSKIKENLREWKYILFMGQKTRYCHDHYP